MTRLNELNNKLEKIESKIFFMRTGSNFEKLENDKEFYNDYLKSIKYRDLIKFRIDQIN